MTWYDEAIFYHIYPLGLTGAPKTNSYGEPEHRLNTLLPWITHIRDIGCNALYIGPLFESVGHGYETTDYKKLDSRLGTNEDLTAFVEECHRQGIRVILDGVFNHTGRDFFAFQDIKKLNQNNPAVRDYICDVIRFWAAEFRIDGIRLDAADVLDFGYMQALRQTANEIGSDFWLMGEVIHGDYTRWVNEGTLHSVTNYHLHKALYSGHNDHNYFEIAHTVRRLYEMGGNRPDGLKLYNFVDNHDVERIYTKLTNKAHFVPVHILLYTLPGVPSVYYGSEFGIEGKKERYSDDSLRPALSLEDYEDAQESNGCTRLITALGKIRQKVKALSYGDYKELVLTNRQYGFGRNYHDETVLVAVNNDEQDAVMDLPAGSASAFQELLSGEIVKAADGRIHIMIPANSGGIWIPAEPGKTANQADTDNRNTATKQTAVSSRTSRSKQTTASGSNSPAEQAATDDRNTATKQTAAPATNSRTKQTATGGRSAADRQSAAAGPQSTDGRQTAPAPGNRDRMRSDSRSTDGKKGQETKAASPMRKKTYEEMDIEELQQAILERMAMNGPITDRMRQDVMENVYHNSLLNWIRSFH